MNTGGTARASTLRVAVALFPAELVAVAASSYLPAGRAALSAAPRPSSPASDDVQITPEERKGTSWGSATEATSWTGSPSVSAAPFVKV